VRQLARRHGDGMMMEDIDAEKLRLPHQRQADDQRAQPVRPAKYPGTDQISCLCPTAESPEIIIPTIPGVEKSRAGSQAFQMSAGRSGLQLKLADLDDLLTTRLWALPAVPGEIDPGLIPVAPQSYAGSTCHPNLCFPSDQNIESSATSRPGDLVAAL